MLHGVMSEGREVMQDVRRLVNDSESMDDLCSKLAQYWNADELGLQVAAMEWKERASSRQARAQRANRLLQLGKQWPSGNATSESEQDDMLRKSRQMRLELLVEQIAEKVFPN
jgi:hypothetical protein